MKRLFCLTISCCILSVNVFAQDRTEPINRADLNGSRPSINDLRNGYETSTGWVIKIGDTLQLGRGTMPSKAFAFIYDSPGGVSGVYSNDEAKKKYMPSSFADRRVIVKNMGTFGTKRSGFTLAAIVGTGGLTRYLIEVENAVEANEIVPPAQFRRTTNQVNAAPVSVADELLKLKQLLDAGALTQDEFNQQKKKLLNQ